MDCMHATIAEITTAEHHRALLGRAVFRTLLTPDTIEATLGGRWPAKL
jgi:hypothetical protein